MLVNSRPNEETEFIQKRPLKEEIYDALHVRSLRATTNPVTGCARKISPPRWA